MSRVRGVRSPPGAAVKSCARSPAPLRRRPGGQRPVPQRPHGQFWVLKARPGSPIADRSPTLGPRGGTGLRRSPDGRCPRFPPAAQTACAGLRRLGSVLPGACGPPAPSRTDGPHGSRVGRGGSGGLAEARALGDVRLRTRPPASRGPRVVLPGGGRAEASVPTAAGRSHVRFSHGHPRLLPSRHVHVPEGRRRAWRGHTRGGRRRQGTEAGGTQSPGVPVRNPTVRGRGLSPLPAAVAVVPQGSRGLRKARGRRRGPRGRREGARGDRTAEVTTGEMTTREVTRRA